MEKKIGIMFFVFVLLLHLLHLSELQGASHVLHDEEGNKNNNWAWVAQEDKGPEMTQEFSHLIVEEKCEESDEVCVERRMITETHLDYIYTQSHGKP